MYIAGDFDIKEAFLVRFGELTPIYQQPDLLKLAVSNVAKSLKWAIDKLYNVTLLEYNPIENYDRTESWTDTADDDTDNSKTYGDQTINNTSKVGDVTTKPNTVTERKVSAFNETSYQPSEQETHTGSVTESHGTDTDSSTTKKGDDTEHTDFISTRKHDGHVHGNIGVTTTQQMMESEIDLVYKNNYIDSVCQMYAERLLINIW